MECLSFDIEPEWARLLHKVAESAGMEHVHAQELLPQPEPDPAPELQPELQPASQLCMSGQASLKPRPHRMAFVCSDCLTGCAGPQLLESAPGIDLFTFNYVLVENAKVSIYANAPLVRDGVPPRAPPSHLAYPTSVAGLPAPPAHKHASERPLDWPQALRIDRFSYLRKVFAAARPGAVFM